MSSIKLIGLTGQTGSGKSTVSDFLTKNGYAVIDADAISRNVMVEGAMCNTLVKVLFPNAVENGVINRKKLAHIVFSDKDKLTMLNNAVHPFVLHEMLNEIKRFSENNNNIIFFDAPQLFESGIDILCSHIISVVADDEIRLQRILKRDNITENEANKRINSQYSADYFVSHSDFVIYNNGSAEDIIPQIQNIISSIDIK